MLNIAMYDIIQNSFQRDDMSYIVIYVYFYWTIKKQMLKTPISKESVLPDL